MKTKTSKTKTKETHKVVDQDVKKISNNSSIDISKNRQLSDALSQIEKLYGKGSVMLMGEKPKFDQSNVISTGSISLDAALGIGGIPKGRIIEIYGQESSGKTTLTLEIIASAQKNGGICAFIDAEHALDPSYAKRLGICLDSLILSQPSSGEEALDITDTLIKSGQISLIVIDSVAALVPKAELDGDIDQANIGQQARMMSKFLRRIAAQAAQQKCIIIFINQIRQKISTGYSHGPSETTTGGNALKFYSSIRIEVARIGQIKEKEEVIGASTRFKIVKNKVAPPFKVVVLDMIHGHGISKEGELIDVGEKLGIIVRSGAYFYYNGEKLSQGKENVRDLLKKDNELSAKIEKDIRAKFNTVDVDELNEETDIDEQEEQ